MINIKANLFSHTYVIEFRKISLVKNRRWLLNITNSFLVWRKCLLCLKNPIVRKASGLINRYPSFNWAFCLTNNDVSFFCRRYVHLRYFNSIRRWGAAANEARSFRSAARLCRIVLPRSIISQRWKLYRRHLRLFARIFTSALLFTIRQYVEMKLAKQQIP